LNFEKIRKLTGGFLLVSLLLCVFSQPFQQYLHFPKQVRLLEGQQIEFHKTSAAAVMASGNSAEIHAHQHTVSIKGKSAGKEEMFLKLAGIPVKKTEVEVHPNIKMIPGGQSIGVKLNTLGVLIVGHHLVQTDKGKFSPGEQAGIEVGDMILEMNGKKIENMSDIAPIVQQAGEEGKPLDAVIKRDGQTIRKTIKPLKDKSGQSYKLGLYIRDSAAGIGTMTFIDPKTKKYGALGHVISDMDTKKPIVVEKGRIVNSVVTSIEKGKNGSPGEKLARFTEEGRIGNITKNSPFGIFGQLDPGAKDSTYAKPMPIALSDQVKTGPAKILTVVDGKKVEAYSIKIVSNHSAKISGNKRNGHQNYRPGIAEKNGRHCPGNEWEPDHSKRAACRCRDTCVCQRPDIRLWRPYRMDAP